MLRFTLPDVRTSRPARGPAARPRVPGRHFKNKTHITDPLQSALADQLFLHARDALVLCDLRSGRILRWNPSAERLFGYSAPEAIGRPVEMLMAPSVARLHRERVAHYRRSGEADVLTARSLFGIQAVAKNGQELRVELSIAPLEAPGSPPRSILLTFRDSICHKQAEMHALEAARAESAREQAEATLRQCEELMHESTRELQLQAARTRRSATRLARHATQITTNSHAGHDATDASHATDASDAASHVTDPARRVTRLAHVVERRTARLERTLQHASDAAAVHTRTFELRPESVNLVPLVGRVVSKARERTCAHKLSFFAPQSLTAVCDPRRIEDLVQDLIERAILRNPRGCWIDVDLRRPLGGVAQIDVRDYGRPVADRDRERLVQGDQLHGGWHVNQHIVERHGGTLSLESPPEGGLRVIVRLPTHRTRVKE